VQPDLFEAYRPVFWPDLSRRPIGSPTGIAEERPQCVVGGVHPATGTAKSVRPECVRAGVQESRAMASMLRRRIHHEHVDCTVQTLVGVVILAGHRGGKAHHSRAVSRDKDTERSLRRSLDGRAPGVGHLRQ
jgi:hypothetical protein